MNENEAIIHFVENYYHAVRGAISHSEQKMISQAKRQALGRDVILRGGKLTTRTLSIERTRKILDTYAPGKYLYENGKFNHKPC